MNMCQSKIMKNKKKYCRHHPSVQFWILDRIRRVVMNKLVLIIFAILAIVCCGSEAAKRKGRTGRRLTQGLKLSLALERKLMECLEKSLDPCVSFSN